MIDSHHDLFDGIERAQGIFIVAYAVVQSVPPSTDDSGPTDGEPRVDIPGAVGRSDKMRKRAAILLLAGMAGCHDAPLAVPGPPDMANQPLVDDFQAYAAAAVATYCQSRVDCGDIAASQHDACLHSKWLNNFTGNPWGGLDTGYSLEDAIRAGRVRLDRSKAETALQTDLEYNCACGGQFGAFDMGTYTRRGLIALVPVGGSCLADFECADGYCSGDIAFGFSCGGTCQPFLPTGAPCSYGHCGPSDWCPALGTNLTCVPRITLGQACDDSNNQETPCADGLWCMTSANPTMGVCSDAPSSGAGGPCVDNCNPGLYCDSMDICRPREAVGSACSNDYQCAGGLCCLGGSCQNNLVDIGGACDPTVADRLSSGCPADATCDPGSRTCVLPPSLAGAACHGDGDCYPYPNYPLVAPGSGWPYCDLTGHCGMRGMIGDPCNPNDANSCLSLHCDPGSRKCLSSCAR
jgi:hypothetical protein